MVITLFVLPAIYVLLARDHRADEAAEREAGREPAEAEPEALGA